MSNFGFGGNIGGNIYGGGTDVAQQNLKIANIQRENPVDKVDEQEVTGGIDAFNGVAQGQQGLRDVVAGVRKGKENISSALSGASDAQDGFNHAPLLGRPGTSHEMTEMGSQVVSQVHDADGNRHGGFLGAIGNVVKDVTGLGGPSANHPKMNVANMLNGSVGGGSASSQTDDLKTSFQNLHAHVQSGLDKIGQVASKVDSGLDTGLTMAEGALDALGPVGDVLGMVGGVYGAIKSHIDKKDDQQHYAQQSAQLQQLSKNTSNVNTNVTSVGKNLAQQAQQTVQQHS